MLFEVVVLGDAEEILLDEKVTAASRDLCLIKVGQRLSEEGIWVDEVTAIHVRPFGNAPIVNPAPFTLGGTITVPNTSTITATPFWSTTTKSVL